MSRPEHHDELLFIIQHQTTELWLKLVLHELLAARAAFDADDLGRALKCVARVKHIQKTLTEQWSVLATLTPTEYSEFRRFLGNSSGFQSLPVPRRRVPARQQERRNARRCSTPIPPPHDLLERLLAEPSLYDAFWQCLARLGYDVPASSLDRDVTTAYTLNEDLLPLIKFVYENHDEHWAVYEAFEEFVDLEENFQLWRFRHMRTVLRTIGMKSGTGGSSGVGFLQKALDLTFFPELLAVRTEIGR